MLFRTISAHPLYTSSMIRAIDKHSEKNEVKLHERFSRRYTPAGGRGGDAPRKRKLAIPSLPLTATEVYHANTQAHCTNRACLKHPPAI